MAEFNLVWERIVKCQGEEFRTKRGKKFIYRIKGQVLIPSRTNYFLSKTNFSKAFQILPLKGPGEISNTVRGPSYVWAILNDSRILKR
jgi:hypothetical protein